VRSIFVLTTTDRATLEAALDSLGERQPAQWIIDELLYARIDEPPDWSDGWTPEQVDAAADALGGVPPRAVAVDISGRRSGWDEIRKVASVLLRLGPSVAFDDYSERPWRADEIDQARDEHGNRFFEPFRP
jgi:hypothetical protein